MNDPNDLTADDLLTTDDLFDEAADLAEKPDADSRRRERAIVAELKKRGAIRDLPRTM
jgi:hypothetical protein